MGKKRHEMERQRKGKEKERRGVEWRGGEVVRWYGIRTVETAMIVPDKNKNETR